MESIHSSFNGYTSSCNCTTVSEFTPNTLFTGGEDGTVCVVSTDQGNLISKIGGCVFNSNERNCRWVCQSLIIHVR